MLSEGKSISYYLNVNEFRLVPFLSQGRYQDRTFQKS